MDAVKRIYHQLDNVFTPSEAWGMFRFITYAETIGWMLLVAGIITKIVHLEMAEWFLPVAGSIHGMIFISYIFLILFLHRSMRWSLWNFLWAEAACNVPFGALVFEYYIERKLHPRV